LKNGQVQTYLIFNSVEPEEESVAGVVCTMNQKKKKRERGTSTSISLFRSERRPRIFLVGLIMDAFRELATPLAVETHLSISKCLVVDSSACS
jgi:hypothetical protein